MKVAPTSLALVLVPALLHAEHGALDNRVARYTTVEPGASDTQRAPLETIVTVAFPRDQVNTVGQAVHYLLMRTGFRLSPEDQLPAAVQAILTLPLPEVQRRIGPIRVSAALGVLLGEPFRLTSDPLRREIAYTLEGEGGAAHGQDRAGTVSPRR